MSASTPTITELRAQLEKLTGRRPKSKSERYLVRRLAEIEAKKAGGGDVRYRNGSPVTVSVSMPEAARDALAVIVDLDKTSLSKLARSGFARELAARGHHKAAALFGAEDA